MYELFSDLPEALENNFNLPQDVVIDPQRQSRTAQHSSKIFFCRRHS